MTLEYTGLRVINVENFGATTGAAAPTCARWTCATRCDARLGAANKTATKKELRNVGPSITYKLRDAAGQAREFHNYMLPVDLGDGAPVFLLGLRDTPAEPFRYLRMPADDQGGMDGFLRLRAALADPALREQAVRRYAAKATDPSRPELAQQLAASAGARAGAVRRRRAPAQPARPAARACRRSRTSWRPTCRRPSASAPARCWCASSTAPVRAGAAHAASSAGLKPLAPDEKTQAFMTQAVLALTDCTSTRRRWPSS